MTIRPWKTHTSRYVLEDKWIKVRADRCETSDGTIIEPYYVQEPSDWVHVIAFDSQDRILITRQYRHGSQSIVTEIPCGCVEPGEEPLAAMQRELLEETGCEAEIYEQLPAVSPNPARYANKVFPFIALETRQVGLQHLDISENIEFEFVTVPTLLSWIDDGHFQQPLHIASVFLTLRKRAMLTLRGVEQTNRADGVSRLI